MNSASIDAVSTKAAKRLAASAMIVASLGLLASGAEAQTGPIPSPARPAATVAAPAQARTQARTQAPEPQQKCLRALNGACTNPVSVEEARMRAVIIPAAQVSYLGTPAGTFGGEIPFERFFQDNPLLYGLPTFTLVTPCCTTRTK